MEGGRSAREEAGLPRGGARRGELEGGGRSRVEAGVPRGGARRGGPMRAGGRDGPRLEGVDARETGGAARGEVSSCSTPPRV